MMLLEKKIANLLIQKNKTLSIAESCTGGLLTHRLTNVPGSSQFFRLGVIAYSYDSKVKVLNVPSSLIKQFGAVSRPAAQAMSQSVRKILRSDIGIGITGIAGPAGGTKIKPVGLVFIAMSSSAYTFCQEYYFKGTRLQIKQQAATQALKLFLKFL